MILFLILQIKPISYSELKNRHSSGQVATPVLLSQKIYTIEKNDLRKIQQISMTKVDDSETNRKTRSRKSSIFVEGLQNMNFAMNQRKISGRTTDLNFSLLKRIS